MKKVCLLAFSTLDMAPYVKRYMMLLDGMGVPYDVISREHISQKGRVFAPNNFVEFFEDAHSPAEKMLRFHKYRVFVKKILTEKNYDRIIAFTAMGVFLNGQILLSRQYRGNYIVDIRDYNNLFSNGIFSALFGKIVKNSYATILSSRGFLSWFPRREGVYISHNIPNFSSPQESVDDLQNKEDICIGYLGGINYLDANVSLVKAFSGNPRFRMLYAGIYPEKYNIRDYCKENNVQDVEFQGAYSDADKAELYAGVDIINAVYGNESITVCSALPNKLYDCIYYKKPIMVCANTYLAEVVQTYDLGFSVDPGKDDILGNTEQYLKTFDKEKFLTGCMAYLDHAKAEQTVIDDLLRRFVE